MNKISIKLFFLVFCLSIFIVPLQAQNYKNKRNDYSRFRIAATGGFGYRTAEVSSLVASELVPALERSKSGFHYDGDFTFYFSRFLGIALKYNNFHSSLKINYQGTSELHNYKTNIRFAGPLFAARFLRNNNLHCTMGMGYMGYKSNLLVPNDANIKFTGTSLGFYTSVGYDVNISKHWGIGFQLAVVSGVLTRATYSSGDISITKNLEPEMYENMSNLNLSVGIRFNR